MMGVGIERREELSFTGPSPMATIARAEPS